MKLLNNDEIRSVKWNKLLEKSPFSSPFQTPKYYNFYNSVDGLSSDVFAVEKNDKYVALAVVTIEKEKGIKSFFSKRGIIDGGPLVMHNEEESLQSLLAQINSFYRKKLIYLETRNYFDYSSHKEQFERSGFKYVPWLNFHLKTSDTALMKKSMSSSRLRQVKKAIKNGVEWRVAEKLDDVISFYEILSDLYKNKIKKPLLNKEFFIEFHNQNIGKYLLVYSKEKVIGGIVCPVLSNKAVYEFYICGLDSEYRNEYPSVMATWAAMEYANQEGIPLFDFMGAGSPDKNYGVREFKSKFGGELIEYGRFLKIINPVLYKVGVLGLSILSKMK